MGTSFFTNEKENTLLEKIEEVFKYKKVHFFDALVGYFRTSGYFRIRKFIQQTPHIRILAGINVDKLTYQANQQGLLFNPNAEQSQEEFFNDIKKNIQEAQYDKEVEDGMYQFIEDIVSGRIEMRIHPKQNIHAKIYIFREEVDDNIQFATETFERLWAESVAIDITHIEKIKIDSYLNPNFTPYEVYLKFLLEYFGRSIDFDPNSVSDLPKGYKKLSYQVDAVNDGYSKMMKHNGFFLSDVVGLGKTVILVSATPLNNRPEDIANLVYLFQDSKDSTLEEGNLQRFFREQIDEYKKIKSLKEIELISNGIKAIYEKIRVKVVEPLTVRRTRTDLMENEAYRKDLEKQKVHFPDIKAPHKMYYELDKELERLYDNTIKDLSGKTDGLKYYRYQAIGHLVESKKKKYPKADPTSKQLASIMKTLLVKRIDSSFFAFKKSLHRYHQANQVMLNMFDKGVIYIAPNLKVNELLSADKEEELIRLIEESKETDPTIEKCTPDDFDGEFHEGLKHDGEILDRLVKAWDKITYDPKLDKFIDVYLDELFDKSINQEGKLVIFSESKETTKYLSENLKEKGLNRILTVHSDNRNDQMSALEANFDANYKGEKKAKMKLFAFHAALGEDSQIYSTDESPESFGLFDKTIDEERDERLRYLMWLRQLKEENPALIKHIAKMPLRARTGRRNELIPMSTITFIRNNRRDAFTLVREDGSIEELTFLEAVKQFEASVEEKSIPLHDRHHEQVAKAIEAFSVKEEDSKATEKKINPSLGPNERKAIAYLDAFVNLPNVTKEESSFIQKAKQAITTGRFQQLQRDVNKLQKATKNTPVAPAVLLERLMEIISAYPLEHIGKRAVQTKTDKKEQMPEIIISKSFSM